MTVDMIKNAVMPFSLQQAVTKWNDLKKIKKNEIKYTSFYRVKMFWVEKIFETDLNK